jgi:hypothetical protein
MTSQNPAGAQPRSTNRQTQHAAQDLTAASTGTPSTPEDPAPSRATDLTLGIVGCLASDHDERIRRRICHQGVQVAETAPEPSQPTKCEVDGILAAHGG